jgi:hypothetical protein
VSEPTPPSADDARAIERIEQALSALDAEHGPPAGWEADVIAARAQAPSASGLAHLVASRHLL